jgi:hypothetical protein
MMLYTKEVFCSHFLVRYKKLVQHCRIKKRQPQKWGADWTAKMIFVPGHSIVNAFLKELDKKNP